VRESDLIIAIGPRLGEMTTGGYSLLEAPRPKQKLVHFHAGAELARVNLHKEALSHFDQASVPPGSKGVPEDWNELVTANKAFLLGDRTALLACSFDGSKDETELSFTFKRPDDPERRLKLTLLAFDIPAENS